MSEAVIDHIRGLDHAREARALAEHVAVTSPLALDYLARERMISPSQEARRLAGIQLRVVTELGARLEWLEAVTHDTRIDPAVRVALAGLARGLVEEVEEVDAKPGLAQAAALLETAVLFHRLLDRLRPWLPPMTIAVEPDAVLNLLLLGIPDYLHPLVQLRFDQLWERFHRLRATATAAAELAARGDEPGAELDRLERTLSVARPRADPVPPPPSWSSPAWINPWLERKAGDQASTPAKRSVAATSRSMIPGS